VENFYVSRSFQLAGGNTIRNLARHNPSPSGTWFSSRPDHTDYHDQSQCVLKEEFNRFHFYVIYHDSQSHAQAPIPLYPSVCILQFGCYHPHTLFSWTLMPALHSLSISGSRSLRVALLYKPKPQWAVP